MRYLLALILTVAVVAPLAAFDLGAHAPDKPVSLHQPPPPDPEVIRQGGDTIADATVIPAIPYYITGTTTGFNDDYDEACPYTGSTSPDVVYVYTPPGDLPLNVDLYGSSYDTKVYVYDESLTLVACNDDYYPDYVSKLEDVPLMGGVVYFIVIDGYGGHHGDYILDIVEYVPPEPCVLECPADGFPEGEPPLVDDYEDAYNGGCNSPEFGVPLQELHGDEQGNLVLCGVAGWYHFQGSDYRDTDWFIVYVGAAGAIEVTGDAEQPTYLFDLGPPDCGVPEFTQNIIVGDCSPDAMTMVGSPGHYMWFWAGASAFTSPDGSHPYEYDYVIWFSGLMPTTVATDQATWTDVKSLFR